MAEKAEEVKEFNLQDVFNEIRRLEATAARISKDQGAFSRFLGAALRDHKELLEDISMWMTDRGVLSRAESRLHWRIKKLLRPHLSCCDDCAWQSNETGHCVNQKGAQHGQNCEGDPACEEYSYERS